MTKFMFATGIENSYPTILLPDGKTFRVDELDKTGHYQHWRQDFELCRELGIEFLRYGPQYYAVHTGPGQYDWSFVDETFTALREMGITVICDLCHFGVPDWLGNFQNPDFPRYFEEFARAFAKRYPHIQFYTPINEIFITAQFSGYYGWWNERGKTDKTFVNALKHLAKANILAMNAILEVRPDAVFIQSESTEYFHPEGPEQIDRANFLNQRRFLSLDLTYGYPISVSMYNYLTDNGMTRKEYEWFAQQDIKAQCIMGNDWYLTNEHIIYNDHNTGPAGEIFGYYVITRQYYDRYRLPIMHTETNFREPEASAWLKKMWANVYRLKADGIPMVGFTWYSLQDQVDWDTALREHNMRVNPLGLVDLNRNIRPVGETYRQIIQEWRPVLEREQYGVHVQYQSY